MTRHIPLGGALLAGLLSLGASCAPVDRGETGASVAKLAGRTAGPPQRCVPARAAETLRVLDETRLVYGSGRTLWVNQLRTRCPELDRMDALVVEPTGSQYCSGDKVRALEPATGTAGPSCILGDFVPYAR